MKLLNRFCHIFICGIFLCITTSVDFDIAFCQDHTPDPYILTEDISHNIPEKDECLKNLTQAPPYTSEKDQQTYEDLQEDIDVLYDHFEKLNEEIRLLEEGELDSITYAEQRMKTAIDDLFTFYVENDDEFSNLSQEKQMQILMEDKVLIEWQQYLENIQQAIAEKVQERDQVESEIQQLSYDISLLQDSANREMNELDTIYESCLILPYSTEKMDINHIYFENTQFSEVMVELDTYLQNLVPKAYRHIKYQHILDVFIEQINQKEETLLQKNPLVFDKEALKKYQFSKELVLKDIQNLAQQALYQYYDNESIPQYVQYFHDVIQTKHQQFSYFYQINNDGFEYLKQLLCDTLNMNQWISDNHIEHIKSIQEKYQVKLVLFNSENRQWQPVDTGKNGFESIYNQYDFESILTDVDQANKDQSLLSQTNPQQKANDQRDSNEKKTKEPKEQKTEDKAPSIANNLSDKMINHMKESRVKNLEPPKKHIVNHEKSPKKSKKKTHPSKDKNMTLPTTGERKHITYIAIILLLIGLLLTFYNIYKNRKEKETRRKGSEKYSKYL